MTLHQRLGRKIAVVVGALSMLIAGSVLPTVSPATADHGIGVSHWSNHEWANAYPVNSVNGRGFYVLDRTNNSTMSSAFQTAINDYTYDQNARGWTGLIPNIVYVSQPEYAGQCGAFPEWTGYHFITVCQTSNPGGVTYTGGTHNGEPVHPYMYITNTFGTFTAAYNIFYHELFHAAGIAFGPCGQGDHSCDPANLLYPVVPVNVIKKPTGHDYDALWAGYVNHPMFQ